MFHRIAARLGLAITFAVGAAATSFAQTEPYPSRPVTVFTGFGAGGGPEVILRIVAERLSRLWGQQVVVLNRPGANNAIGMQAVAQAKPAG